MLRALGRLAKFLCYLTSVAFLLLQMILIVSDVWEFIGGMSPFLFRLAGPGNGALNIVMTLMAYFTPTAYAAFWFVLARGLSHLGDRRVS